MDKLDINQKQNVVYCIPPWLKAEQIRVNIEKVVGRIETQPDREDHAAIVGFGVSLRQAWEKIRDFKYVLSCSGAHKFLIERGIVPTWHVEVDPRAHKIGLLGQPHKDVEYLIASTCHPKYLDHLSGYNVKLWHIFDNEQEAMRTLPQGEWAIAGGCDAGLRTMAIARFLGFRNLHFFGMDGSSPEGEAGRHAAAHPNTIKDFSEVEYEGRTFRTTPAMLEAARGLYNEMNQLGDLNPVFYGDGLIQHMAKFYKRKPVPKKKRFYGLRKPELISASYREQNMKLHNENLAYGVGGDKYAKTVVRLCEKLKTQSVLDYGCGKGYLAKAIPFPIWEYDPAIPGKQESPRAADLVICTDVLEHVEPDKITWVLEDLRRVTRMAGYFVVNTSASHKTLPDGRNTHLIQKGKKWWLKRLDPYFTIAKTIEVPPLLHFVVGPKIQQRAA